MKNFLRTLMVSGLVLTVLAGTYFFISGPKRALACGWGQSGGGDYVPQRRGSGGAGYTAKLPSVTIEQAREIVSSHVSKLNPDLEVGEINDAGSFYEAEILSADKEVVQVLGIDKFSGRLMLLN